MQKSNKSRQRAGRIIIPSGVSPWPHELRIATILSNAGYKVEFIQEFNSAKTADFLLDGIPYELKSPKSSKITGALECPEKARREALEKLVCFLDAHGFTPVHSDLDDITISLPRRDSDEPTINRLRNLVLAKTTILKAALDTEELTIEVDNEKISFPWFTNHHIDGEIEAYQMLVSSLYETAKKLKYVSEVERPQDNLKYAMRLFLVRLGFIGDEYKQARKILLRNLSGNCSWKSGHAPERSAPENNSVAAVSPEHDAYKDIPDIAHREYMEHLNTLERREP